MRSWTAIVCLGIFALEWLIYVAFFVAPSWVNGRGVPHNTVGWAAPAAAPEGLGSIPIGLTSPVQILGLNLASAIFMYNLQDAWSMHVSA